MITPTKKDISAARERISSYIHKTPIQTSKYINDLCHADIFFKCQNLQKTGSFKVRGASNKILQLTNPSGLCTHSSGNHAQAVAYIASKLGIKASIVMPIDTPDIKKNAVKSYGAEIILSGPTVPQQQRESSRIAKQSGAAFIHPYNDLQIISGASTCAMEIYEEIQNLDYLVVPIGGGGLCSGSLIATLAFSPSTKVIGVQPFLARDAKESLQKNCIQPQYPPLTLAQGVRTNIGDVTFEFLKKYLSDIILVSEDEMIEASKLFQERMKMIVQLSGAIVLAAIKKDPRFKGKRVAAIISGGNMDLSLFFKQMRANL